MLKEEDIVIFNSKFFLFKDNIIKLLEQKSQPIYYFLDFLLLLVFESEFLFLFSSVFFGDEALICFLFQASINSCGLFYSKSIKVSIGK